jgi:uncharacterized protein (TIGR04255 family)
MLNDGPDFGRPPVAEVVCGVQFSGTDGWCTPHFGSFWELIRAEYPEFEDQPPLDKLRFERAAPPEPRLSLLPPLRRVFFVQPPGNFLIQLQQNRILHNWRKVNDSDEYPRFKEAYKRFVWSWEKLKHFAVLAALPDPQPEALELTYVNHITKDGAKFPRDVWDFLEFYAQTPKAVIARESSVVAMHFGWPLPNEMGILTFDLKHGLRPSDESEVLLIEFNARGKVKPDGVNMDNWFDTAHSAIVRTFDALTTDAAHKLWEKQS